jgi:hypothetical protein
MPTHNNTTTQQQEFLRHESTCPTKNRGGCPLCKRISNLLMLHARQCKEESCNVPKCHEIRDQIRQAAQRQQQMDDSRRRMMNDMYRPQDAARSGGGSAESQQPEDDE